MNDPKNPLNLLLTIESALHKAQKGRWPNATREAVQGLRRALAARYETPAGPVYGSIDACAEVQTRFAQSTFVGKPVLTDTGEQIGRVTRIELVGDAVQVSVQANEGREKEMAAMVRSIEGPVSIGYRKP